jgi:hypothetical protein
MEGWEEQTGWNDFDFAKYLGTNGEWKSVQTGGNAVSFLDSKNKVIAFALYDNSKSTFRAFIPSQKEAA